MLPFTAAFPPSLTRSNVEGIVLEALDSAIPEPWEVASAAAARIMALTPKASDVQATLEAALAFIEEEAENRSAAGSTMSDYEREPRELAERLRAALTEVPS